jgi:hypothetical protein
MMKTSKRKKILKGFGIDALFMLGGTLAGILFKRFM